MTSKYSVKLISGPSPKRYQGLIKYLNPLRYYKMDETSGTTAIDASGNANGTYVGAPLLNQPGLIADGTSVYFDGVDDRLDNGTPSLPNEFTACCWLNYESKASGIHVIFGMPQGTNYLMAWIDNALRFRINDGSGLYDLSAPLLNVDSTYFLAFRRNSGGRSIWVNDEVVAEDYKDNWVTPTGTFSIGNRGAFADNWFKGNLDEFAVYDKYLTDQQLAEIYEEGPLTPFELIKEMPFARCSSIEYQYPHQGVARITIPTTEFAHSIKTRGRREIQVWRGEEKMFEGPVWTVWGDSKNTFMQVEPIESYFAKRHIEETKNYVDTDIYNIMWDLINYTQTEHGTLGITATSFLPIGITKDAYYPVDEHANIAELLNNFPDVEWFIEIYNDGRREWTPYSPSRTALRLTERLEWGGLVVDYRYSYHGIDAMSKVIWAGRTYGPNKPEGSYHDPNISDLHVYLSIIRKDHHVMDIPTLNEMSRKLVKEKGRDQILPDIQVANNPDDDYDFIATLRAGDVFPIYINHSGTILLDGLFKVDKITLDTESDSAWLNLVEYDDS